MLTPAERFGLITETAAMRVADEPTLLPSYSNDAWGFTDAVFGPCVLRICHQGDRARLVTEARIGRALPRRIGHPRVLSYGWTRDDADLSWLLSPRLTGRPLAEVWPELTEPDRVRAADQCAARLRLLHRWRPSAALVDRLLSWRRRDDADGIIGATLLPLPYPRAEVVAAAAVRRAGLPADLIERALRWLREHSASAPMLDRPDLTVTHGDLHLGNVWWDGRRVGGLLDLEWVRLGPPYLDLARTDDDEDGREFGRLVSAAYPELDVPGLSDRLRYLRISYELRQLLTWPTPGADVQPDHPAVRLAELLDALDESDA